MRKSYLLVWLGTVLLVGFFWIYFPTLSRYRDLKIQEEKITHELKDLTTKINSLKEERALLKNDVEYLEKVIRKELGLVKPGEMVYKFVEEEPKKETPVPPPAEALPEKSSTPESISQTNVEGSIAAPASTIDERAKDVYPRQETR